MLEQEKIFDLQDRAKRYFAKNFRHLCFEAEDFAQWATIQYMQGRHPSTDLKFIAVDYFRSSGIFARSSRGREITRRNLRQSNSAETDAFERLESNSREPEGRIRDVLGTTREVTWAEKLALVVRYEWGYTNQEIADCIGVGGSRISQRYSELLKRVQAALPAGISQSKPDLRFEFVGRVLQEKRQGLEPREDQGVEKGQSLEVAEDNEESREEWFI